MQDEPAPYVVKLDSGSVPMTQVLANEFTAKVGRADLALEMRISNEFNETRAYAPTEEEKQTLLDMASLWATEENDDPMYSQLGDKLKADLGH